VARCSLAKLPTRGNVSSPVAPTRPTSVPQADWVSIRRSAVVYLCQACLMLLSGRHFRSQVLQSLYEEATRAAGRVEDDLA
jgi:hypothetical protein